MYKPTREELCKILDTPIFKTISETADSLGMECYVVGGYVRDIFLERPSTDIDVVVVGKGIEMARAGGRIGDISHAVQSYVEAAGFSVVRQFVGHGIGTKLHEAPEVPNFGNPGRGIRLMPGMTLAIEPMVNMGSYDVKTQPDGWTVLTADGSLSAHFEHTVAITPNGPVIMTTL